MRDFIILFVHVIVTVFRLARPGGTPFRGCRIRADPASDADPQSRAQACAHPPMRPPRLDKTRPAEVPGVAKKGQDVHIPHCYILRFDTDSKITRLDAYWANTVLNSIKASGV
jgi:hypothetical protein